MASLPFPSVKPPRGRQRATWLRQLAVRVVVVALALGGLAIGYDLVRRALWRPSPPGKATEEGAMAGGLGKAASSKLSPLLDEWTRSGKLALLESLTSTSPLRIGADVEGANIDHNGSTANPCLTERPLLHRLLTESAPARFAALGMASFLLRSAYRISARTFVAIGLSALPLHEHKQGRRCQWVAGDYSRIEGALQRIWPGEHHDLMYESAIYRCDLEKGTPPGLPGTLFMTIDEEVAAVYREESGRYELEPTAPFKHELAFCSFPVYREVLPQRLAEWVQYAYRVLNVDYFVLHDGGSIDASFMEFLDPYVSAGLMEIVDIRAQFQFESKHNVLTLNDCLYRTRWTAKWTIFFDFDEYLYVDPPRTLRGILKEHSEAPYVTFGSLWWSVRKCRNSDGRRLWPVERMSFHWPHMYCVSSKYPNEQCLNYLGHRKYAVNPRKVWVLEVHRPVDPIDGGVDLNTSIARNNHYQGLLRASLPACSELETEAKIEWWEESFMVAKAAESARLAGPPTRKIISW